MGRSRITLRRIEHHKARNVTFKKRYEGLLKKVKEFATLCDVDVCMISFRPQQHPGRDDCQTWPTDGSEVFRIIKRYMDCPEAERKQRMVDLAKFARDQEEKMRKKMIKTPIPIPAPAPEATSFPSWDPRLNYWPAAELKKLLFTLDSKLASVKERIKLLEGKKRLDYWEEGRITKPWNSNPFLNIYNSNTTDAAAEYVKLLTLPPSCFNLPTLLPSTNPIDFGICTNVIEGGLAACNMPESDELKPNKNLQDLQNMQQLLYDPCCLNNPHVSEIGEMALGIHQEPTILTLPTAQFYPPNFGASEGNEFVSTNRKDMNSAAANSDIWMEVHRESKPPSTYRDQSFRSPVSSHHLQMDMVAAAVGI